MLSRLDTLITMVRSATENQEVSSSIGIPDSEFIRYFNGAQDRIVAKIIAQNKTIFGKEHKFSTVSGQEEYPIPTTAFIGNKIVSVEYSTTGLDNHYYNLDSRTFLERRSDTIGHPSSYILRNGKILLNPTPSATGTVRLTYLQRPPNVELRRGTVSAVTLNNVAKTITSLTITGTASDVAMINNEHNYFCIVDRLGNIKMKAVLLAATGITGAGPYTVNIDSSFVFEEGETIAVGDYLIPGDWASSHLQLDEQLEYYLITYVTAKIYKRDSAAQDAVLLQAEIDDLEKDIMVAYAGVDAGYIVPPMVHNFEDWGGI